MLARSSLIVMVCLAVSGAFEIARTWLVAWLLPAEVADGFLAVLVIPWIVITLVNATAKIAIVPQISDSMGRGEYARARYVANRAEGLFWLVCVPIVLAALIAPDAIVGVILPGFGAAQVDVAVTVLPVLSLTLLALPSSARAAAVRNAQSRFVVAALDRSIRNLPPLVYILIARSQTNVVTLSWLFVAGALMNLIVQASGKRNYLFFGHSEPSPAASLAVRNALVTTGGHGVRQISGFVDRLLLSEIIGGVAVFVAIGQTFVSAGALISAGLQTVMLTSVSKMNARSGSSAVREWSHGFTLGVCASMMVFFPLAALAPTAMEIVMLRGGIGDVNSQEMMFIIALFSLGIPVMLVGQLASAYFYGVGDALLPNVQMGVNVTLNIALAVLLFNAYGILGVVIATVSTFGFNAVCMVTFLRRRIRRKHDQLLLGSQDRDMIIGTVFYSLLWAGANLLLGLVENVFVRVALVIIVALLTILVYYVRCLRTYVFRRVSP